MDALAHIKFWISSDDQIAARPHINSLATDALHLMHAEYRIPGHQPHTSAHDESPEMEDQNSPRPFFSMEEHYMTHPDVGVVTEEHLHGHAASGSNF